MLFSEFDVQVTVRHDKFLVHLVGFIIRMLFSGCRINARNENEVLQPEDAILQYYFRVYTVSVHSEDPCFQSRAVDRQS